MIPSLASQGLLSVCTGPNSVPAVAATPMGDRAKTRMLSVHACGFGKGVTLGGTLYANVIEPPAVGLPSTAYHWRSSGVVVTPAHVEGTKVRPWSDERAVAKLAA